MLAAFIQVLALSLLAAVCTELITWQMVYKRSEYKSLKAESEKLAERIEKEKEKELQVVGKNKNLTRLEDQRNAAIAAGGKMGFKSGIFVAVAMIAFFRFLSTTYEGVVVAKLPFTPWTWFQGLTHRNIEGEDMTDCSALFVYVLSSIFFKGTIQKIHGLAIRGKNMPKWMEPPKNM